MTKPSIAVTAIIQFFANKCFSVKLWTGSFFPVRRLSWLSLTHFALWFLPHTQDALGFRPGLPEKLLLIQHFFTKSPLGNV